MTSKSPPISLLYLSSFIAMAKRRKLETQFQALLPGLPDHVAQLCLSRLDPSLLFSVSRSWRRLLYSPSFPPFLSLYALLCRSGSDFESEFEFEFESESESPQFFEFDPISSSWQVIPAPPLDPSSRLLLRHPSFISRTLPVQSVAVAGKLVLLAATAGNLSPALPNPLVFDPVAAGGPGWDSGPTFLHPRRWCAAGVSGAAVYVASGIGPGYTADVARSAEKWEVETNRVGDSGWVRLGGLRDGRLSRDAIDAVGWRGKLCMVNVKGRAAKEGAVYDVAGDEWSEMSPAMLAGWRGPAAALDERELFVVDEEDGVLRRFDPEAQRWVTVTSSERLRGAEQAAAGGGRVCVVCGGGTIVVVDVSSSPARSWAVDTPRGLQAVAVHVLPRMTVTKPHVTSRFSP